MTTTTRRRMWWVIGTIAVLAVAAGGLAWRFIGGDEPAEVALSSPSSGATVSAAPSEGSDGTWTVDTAATTADGVTPFAGYRIEEELGGIGANTAVGQTSGVSGSMAIEGTQVTSLDVTVDMTTLVSDDDRRDGQLSQRGLETAAFPTATFTLTEPIDVGSEPGTGEVVEATATGDLTLHGVTNTVEVPVQARWNGSHIEVVASFDVALADYAIEPPVGFLVLSIADTGTVEMQLLFGQGTT
jgi:polyisoprenoid-binding protein YceI